MQATMERSPSPPSAEIFNLIVPYCLLAYLLNNRLLKNSQQNFMPKKYSTTNFLEFIEMEKIQLM
jgi:hypothetical protein